MLNNKKTSMKSFWEVNKCFFLKEKAVKDVFYDWLSDW